MGENAQKDARRDVRRKPRPMIEFHSCHTSEMRQNPHYPRANRVTDRTQHFGGDLLRHKPPFCFIGRFDALRRSGDAVAPAHERKSQFDLGGYSFREAKTLKDWETFYKVAANAYRSDLQKAIGARRKIDSQVIAREHRASDGKREGSFLAFIAIENCQPVGTICIFFDHGEHGLPIEGEANIDLGPWRRKGAVAEIGRLSLIRTHRFNPFLLKGLFKCVVEAAAEKSIWFIFNDSFVFQRRIYEKIGFSALFEKPYLSSDENSTGYGLKVLPMVMSLVRMIRMDEETSMASDLRGILAPYVIERFFKRLVIRETLGLLPCLKHNIREAQDAKT